MNGTHNLTVKSGTGAVDLAAQAGGLAPLGTVSLTGGAVTLDGIDAAGLGIVNSGVLTLDSGNYAIATPTPYVFGAATTNGVLTLGQATTFGTLTLGSATTLNSSAINGAITFSGTVNGAFGLTVNSGTGAIDLAAQAGGLVPLGTVSLTGGAVTLSGVDAAGLGIINSGVLTLDGGDYTIGTPNPYVFGAATTNGTLTLGQATKFGPLTLGSATTLNSGNFAQTFATVAGAQSLTVNAGTGSVTLNGAVGSSATPLMSLSLTGGALNLNGGSITTSNGQTYTGPVALLTGTTLDSSAGGGNIAFSSTVGGAQSLTVKAGTGSVTLNGAVGTSATPLASLTLSGGALNLDGGAIFTSGVQDYQQAVTLGTGTALTGSTISFEKTLDGPYALTVNGNAVFDGIVGTTPLASLTVTGTALIDTGAITTSGLQTYGGAVTLAADSMLTSANGNIGFGATLDGKQNLTVAATNGTVTFGNVVGGITPLASLTVAGTSQINTTGITTVGTQTYQNAVVLGSASTLATTNSTITFGTTLDGANALTVQTGTASTLFDGAVGATTPLASLTVAGPSQINAGSITTTGMQDYQQAVTLLSDSKLTSGSNVTFANTVDGNVKLLVAGNAVFDGVVGGTTELANLEVTGTSLIDTGTINAVGQAYDGAATLGIDTTLTGTLVAFGSTLDGGYALKVAGNAAFGGVVGGMTPLASLTVTGTTAINGGKIVTSGLQDYQDAVTLGAADTLMATSGPITFEKTLDGPFDLAVNAGTGLTTFSGAVGANTRLTSLTVAGPIAINGGSVLTTGSQAYNGAVTLGAATTLGGSTVTFAQTLDGGFDTTVSGNGVFGGVVGGTTPLASLTVTGTSQINTAAISTAGLQNYQGGVTLGSDSTLTSANSTISFGATIDGAQNLTVAAPTGTITFSGVVGGTTPLTSLTATATGAAINAAINAGNITLIDSGPAGSTLQVGDPVTGMPSSTGFVLSSGAISNLLATESLIIDASQFNKPKVVTGNFSIASSVTNFGLYGLNSIYVYGNILGTGSKLTTLQIGGDKTTATDTTSTTADLATQLIIVAKPAGGLGADGTPANNTPATAAAAGGAINAGTAALSLNAASIAAGQDQGFLGMLGADPGGTLSASQAQSMINNPGSSLYYSAVGGGGRGVYATPNIINAGTLTVRYTNFALFQNTAVPGTNTGVTLGSAAKPLSPALTIYGGGTTNSDPFAIFGVINGVRDVQTALLGSATINAQNISPPISRINGCVIGSSAGCLTPAPLSTVLQVVDAEHITIFYANADYIVAFDPLVGNNNEALFDDFSSLGIVDVRDPTADCQPGSKTPCPAKEKGAHP